MTRQEEKRLLLWRKLGIAGVVALLVLALAAVGGARWYRHYRDEARKYACDLAMDMAQDTLDETWLTAGTMTYAEAVYAAEHSKVGREDLCPSGGDWYIDTVEGREPEFVVVCGMHDSDGARRARLNGARALEQLAGAVAEDRYFGRPDPDSVRLTLNSRSYTAKRVDAPVDLSLGTGLTPGYSGVAILYTLDETGVGWFCYADETDFWEAK